jgi:NADH-quinone oxidoreductase subunit H
VGSGWALIIEIGIILVKIFTIVGIMFFFIAYLSLAERRVSGFIQDRLGPNRVGYFGLLQPLADGAKFFFKEDIIPNHVHKVLYILSPMIILVPALLAFAVIPFGDTHTLFGQTIRFQIADINVGLLFIFAMATLDVYGVLIGGWASNNKYSLFGGLRGSAQLISYEVGLGLSIVGIFMICGTLRLNGIVDFQTESLAGFLPAWIPRWNIFLQPVAFVLFVIAILAEVNRIPFDLPEAEAEIVAGYHTEYSSFKFMMFPMSEYANMITWSALAVVLFFGGWHFPGVGQLPVHDFIRGLIYFSIFWAKTAFFMFCFLWVRWTYPRLRYDQLMKLGWVFLLPMGLLNIMGTGVVLLLIQG